MPTYKVTDPNTNKTVKLTGDSPPSEQELETIFSQLGSKQTSQATPDQYLSPQERLATGFEVSPEKRVAELRAEKGLALGTPMEPVGFNLENLMDLPNDILDIAGPAMPVIGSIVGAIASTPAGAVSGGAATIGASALGAGVGETARQAIGEIIFDTQDADMRDRLIRVGGEAVLAGVGEGVGLGAIKLINKGAKGLVKTGNKILSKQGASSYARWFNKMFHMIPIDDTNYAIRTMRQGIKDAIDPKFSGLDGGTFVQDKLIKTIFGKEGIAKTIKQYGNNEGVRSFYKSYLGLTDDVIDSVFKYGPDAIDNINDTALANLSNTIYEKLPILIDDVGKSLSQARLSMANNAGGEEVTKLVTERMTSLNKMLASRLQQEGIVVPVGKGFRVDKGAIKAGTKSSQKVAMFDNFIQDFFKKVKPKNPVLQELDTISKLGDGQEILSRLTQLQSKLPENISSQVNLVDEFLGGKLSQTVQGLSELMGEAPIFEPARKLTFSKVAKEMTRWKNALDDANFKGPLSSILTEYKKGITQMTEEVARMTGDDIVVDLASKYSQLLELGEPLLKSATIPQDIGVIENTLTRLYGISKESGARSRLINMDRFLKQNLDVNLISTMDRLGARKALMEAGAREDQVIKRLMSISNAPYSRTNANTVRTIANTIDKQLKRTDKISHILRAASASKHIHTESAQLFRGRLIQNTLTGLGGGAGLLAGGLPAGVAMAGAGFGAGMAIQRPAAAKAAIKLASKRGGKQLVAPTVSSGRGASAGIQTLAQLLKTIT